MQREFPTVLCSNKPKCCSKRILKRVRSHLFTLFLHLFIHCTVFPPCSRILDRTAWAFLRNDSPPAPWNIDVLLSKKKRKKKDSLNLRSRNNRSKWARIWPHRFGCTRSIWWGGHAAPLHQRPADENAWQRGTSRRFCMTESGPRDHHALKAAPPVGLAWPLAFATSTLIISSTDVVEPTARAASWEPLLLVTGRPLGVTVQSWLGDATHLGRRRDRTFFFFFWAF